MIKPNQIKCAIVALLLSLTVLNISAATSIAKDLKRVYIQVPKSANARILFGVKKLSDAGIGLFRRFPKFEKKN